MYIFDIVDISQIIEEPLIVVKGMSGSHVFQATILPPCSPQ
jgi:hypothetical protein